MKKEGIWNAELAQIVASCGHGKTIVINDAGFPIPKGVPVIDLAVCRGIPRFMDVLQAILSELVVEEYYLAKPMQSVNPEDYRFVTHLLKKQKHEEISQKELVERAKEAIVCIRTGEDRPYCNLILRSASCAGVFVEQYAI